MSRRKARELALRVMYQRDVGHTEPEQALDQALASSRRLSADAREFARALVLGTIEHVADIDRLIGERSLSWPSERMPHIDRNILRLGCYELLHYRTPAAVCITEAVKLARQFSTAESSRFVHGLLGRINDDLMRTSDHD